MSALLGDECNDLATTTIDKAPYKYSRDAGDLLRGLGVLGHPPSRVTTACGYRVMTGVYWAQNPFPKAVIPRKNP
jgi:hypothetical protein